jgi:DNA-binding beta-propeller fold protein YncE
MKRPFIAAAALLATAASLASASTPSYRVIDRHVLGGQGKWDYLTLDAAAHRLYIARGNRVMVMDTQSGKLVGEIAGAVGAHRVVILPDLHQGFVTNGHADSVMPFDLATLKPLPAIAISGKDPDAMLFDKASAKLWTFNGHSSTTSLIDPVSKKEVGSLALPGRPEFGVTDDAGNIYVNLEDTAQIAKIDAKARKVLATWSLAPCEGPTGLAIDAVHARLFSVCANQKMVVLDAKDGRQVAVLPIGNDPDAAGYDAATGNVFSSNADGTLTIVHQDDADHYSVAANLKTVANARTLALDEVSHRVYLAAPDVTLGANAAQGTFGVLVVGEP